jgi:hypothetical protein
MSWESIRSYREACTCSEALVLPKDIHRFAVQWKEMRLRGSEACAVCGWLLVAGSASAQQTPPPSPAPSSLLAPPSSDDQRVLLARVRQEAIRYQRELPDFLCTQLTTRSVDATATGKHWKQRDTLEVEDVYISGFVNHKLILLNGVAAHNKNYQQLTGFLSETVLHSVGFLPAWLFGPQAKTQFEWLREATLDGRRVQVFSVHLPPSDSKLVISTPRHSFIAGVDGVIFVDAMYAVVRRFEIRMDLPAASAIQEGQMDIDYARVDISGRQFFLPVKFEVRARFGTSLVKNETEVVRYQKYASETTIHFDEPPLEGDLPNND